MLPQAYQTRLKKIPLPLYLFDFLIMSSSMYFLYAKTLPAMEKNDDMHISSPHWCIPYWTLYITTVNVFNHVIYSFSNLAKFILSNNLKKKIRKAPIEGKVKKLLSEIWIYRAVFG